MTDVERGGRVIREVEVRHLGYEAPEMGIAWWQRVLSLQPPWQWIRDRNKNEMKPVLKNVSFKVSSGQILAIMGESSK